MKKKTFMLAVTCLCLAAAALSAAGKKEGGYPTRAITMIVPYSPGGTTDIAGRQLAVLLGKQLGQSITVVNQAGASGATGTKTVLDAPADGYTVLFCAESLGTQRVMGLSQMSYDDFIPIMAVVNDPKVIVVKKGKYATLKDLIDDMKARPGKVKMSYTGPGGSGHVQALVYNKFGLDMALTAYAGGGDAIVAVLGDQVDFTNSNYSTVTSYVESGDMVLLGISATGRLPTYPNVPTLAEAIPGAAKYLEVPFTPLSLMVNKNSPAEVVQTLRSAVQKVVQSPEWKEYVKQNCLEELYLKYPDEASMRKFYADWESYVSWLLYDAGATKFSPEQFGIKRSDR
jgi:tripartite-type tricarboxylate transporter receptor subunit TctC